MTVTPTEYQRARILECPRWARIVLEHKYNLGTVLGNDPGMKKALDDFFANHYERVNCEIHELDSQEQISEIRKKALQLMREGKVKELIDKGYSHTEVMNYAANELIKSGWAERFAEQKQNLEANQLYLADITIKRRGTTTLLDILGSDFGNPDKKCYCDIYMEDRNGNYNLLGKRCIRIGEKNPIIEHGDTVKLIIQGRDAQGIETRLKAILSPEKIEMSAAERREAEKWPYAFA